jgi:hypothetical protein
MKNCHVCDMGPVYPLTHSFNDGCDDCAARHFAHLQDFYESRKAKNITTGYKAALDRRFGVDGATAGHEAAKVWAGKIAAARAALKI